MKRTVGADQAGGVVEVAARERYRALAEDAAGGAGTGVGQRLAVGVDAERASGLDQAGVVAQCAALDGKRAAGGEAAAGVVEGLPAAVKSDVLPDQDAAGVVETAAGQGQRLRRFDAPADVAERAQAGINRERAGDRTQGAASVVETG